MFSNKNLHPLWENPVRTFRNPFKPKDLSKETIDIPYIPIVKIPFTYRQYGYPGQRAKKSQRRLSLQWCWSENWEIFTSENLRVGNGTIRVFTSVLFFTMGRSRSHSLLLFHWKSTLCCCSLSQQELDCLFCVTPKKWKIVITQN